ncbi:hypothetical protein CIK05_06900 [Bdellovibrio sp. qaytius]|nr:hypothetical protein CIK05_06900 [Bdellovibrio sp. qaytius]
MTKLMFVISLVAAQTAFANDYLKELQKIEDQVKVSVTVQYQCKGENQEAGRFGFITFDKSHIFNNLNNVDDRTNWSKNGRNDTLTAKLVPAAPINHSYTLDDLKVWEYMPETIKGIRAVGNDNTQDMIITFNQATTSALGSNQQTFASEQVEQMITTGTLVAVDHTTGEAIKQNCDVIVQKCEGVNCVNRVVLQNYHVPFQMHKIN